MATARQAQQTEHDKRTARLAFERSQKKGVTQSGAPITRMNWLYSMVTAHGEFQEYSDFARSWIQGRQANADLTWRHDRRRSSWWELPPGATATDAQAKSPTAAAAAGAGAGAPQVAGAPATLAPPTPTNAGGAGAVDDVTIRDFLGNAMACEEFRKFCTPHSFYIDFLQSVDHFKKKCFDATTPNSESFKVADLMAKRIFSQFLSDEDRKGQGPPILMPAEVARAVVNKLRKAEGQQVDAVMFDSIYNSVYDSLSKNQFPVFVRSPIAAPHVQALRKAKADRKAQLEAAAKARSDEQALAAKRKADADREAQSKMAVHAQSGGPALALMPTGPAGRRESVIASALPSFLVGGYRKDRGGWDAKYKYDKTGAEYKTLVVDIHGIKSAELGAAAKTYVLVSVDSKTLKCAPKAPYKDQVQFQLTHTTQFVELSFWRKGKLHAYFVQPIRDIVEQTLRFEQPTWYHCEGVSANPAAAAIAKAKDPETDLQLSYKLFTSPPAENSKDHEQLEDDEGTSSVANLIRGKVSLKKRRFQKDGFDLDLTYVTDRIIAMGYPSEGTEGVYRNKLTSVQRFFARRHPNCFRLYNLCSERFYDITKFDGCVARFPFDDHNPPYFTLLKEFCKDVHQWLGEHPQNVAAIHCKAGKGRTGTVIACYLMYSRLSVDAESALNFFGVQRTKNNKGVTIPSQIRYVHYFDKYCRIKRRGGQPPGRTVLFLQSLYFRGIPHDLKSANSSIWFTIEQRDPTNRDKKHTYSSKGHAAPLYHKKHNSIQFDTSKKLVTLNEDVLFTFFHGGIASSAKMFQFWINTRFVELQNTGSLVIRDDDPLPYGAPGTNPMMFLKKKEIDKADKDKKHKKYPADFRVELVFARTTTAAEVLPKELAQADQIVRAS